MKTKDFIYLNTAKLLTDKHPKVKAGLIASAAGCAKGHYMQNGNFKGKCFDACFKVAEEHLKRLIKAKL